MGDAVRNRSLEMGNDSRHGMSSESGVGGPEEVLVDPDPDEGSGTSRTLASPTVY